MIASAEQRFLRDTAAVPGQVFDAVRDFGAKGDGQTDDTAAVQAAIDAARQAGRGAIAYLPTGRYVCQAADCGDRARLHGGRQRIPLRAGLARRSGPADGRSRRRAERDAGQPGASAITTWGR